MDLELKEFKYYNRTIEQINSDKEIFNIINYIYIYISY